MTAMNGRERVLCALTRQVPDRVPFLEPVISENIALELLGLPPTANPAGDEISQSGEDVLIGTLFNSAFYAPDELAREIGLDGIGMYLFLRHEGIKQDIGGRTMIRQGGITSWEDARKIKLPDPDDPALYEPYREFVARYRHTGLALYTFLNLGSDPVILGMGLENFAVALYEQPELVAYLLDLYTDWYAVAVSHLCETGLDFLWFGDDIAYKTAPYVSPRMFHDVIVPRFRKVAQQCRLPWIYHSDGNLFPIMDDLLSLGMSGLHPLEPEAMDIGDIKRRFGDQVCLVGGISVDRLSRGTPDEIEGLVRHAINTAAPGGGYMVASSNSIASYCRAVNVRAMAEATLRYGHYPIGVDARRE